ncbi:hypothetical protein V2W45_1490403 [Cenococcum geophilum]
MQRAIQPENRTRLSFGETLRSILDHDTSGPAFRNLPKGTRLKGKKSAKPEEPPPATNPTISQDKTAGTEEAQAELLAFLAQKLRLLVNEKPYDESPGETRTSSVFSVPFSPPIPQADEEAPQHDKFVEELQHNFARNYIEDDIDSLPSSCSPRASTLSAPRASPSKQIASTPEQVDWRNLVCGLVGADTDASDGILLNSLQNMIKAFEESKVNLKAPKASKPESSYQILHRVQCASNASPSTYVDLPHVHSGVYHLRGQETVSNFELHIERHKELSFVIFKDYACCCTKQYVPATKDGQWLVKKPSTSSPRACVLPLNQWQNDRVEEIFIRNLKRERRYPDTTFGKQLHLFLTFIESDRANEFAEVDAQLSNKVISGKYLEYIFKARDQSVIFKFEATAWDYDGYFQKTHTSLTITLPFPTDKAHSIKALSAYPIRYIEGKQASLAERGRNFWNCRYMQYVSFRVSS